MYIENPFYQEALLEENRKTNARIVLNDMILTNKNIKSIKYDLNINDSEKFTIGGVYGASVAVTLLNYENEFNDIKFENKDFLIDLCIKMDELYTVERFNKELVRNINLLKIKYVTTLWIPQGKFYPTEIVKNENKTITIKLLDKTKYLEEEYVCTLTPPFTLKQLYDDVHKQFQIKSDTTMFYNHDAVIETIPVRIYGETNIGLYCRVCLWFLYNK